MGLDEFYPIHFNVLKIGRPGVPIYGLRETSRRDCTEVTIIYYSLKFQGFLFSLMTK